MIIKKSYLSSYNFQCFVPLCRSMFPPYAWMTSFNISYSAGLLVMDSFFFFFLVCLKMSLFCFVLPLFLKDSKDSSTLWYTSVFLLALFPRRTLLSSFFCCLFFGSSDLSFSVAAFHIFSLSLLLSSLIMMSQCRGFVLFFVFMFFVLGLVELLGLWVYYFNQIWKKIWTLFLLFIWLRCAACGTLVPQPGVKPVPPAVEAWSLNHWTTREVPEHYFFICFSTFLYFWGL